MKISIKRSLWKIFVPWSKTTGLRTLHSEELINLYSSLSIMKLFNLQPAKFHIRHDHNLQTGCEKFRSRQLHTGESVIDQDMYLTKTFIASFKLKFMSFISVNFEQASWSYRGLQIVSQASCEDKAEPINMQSFKVFVCTLFRWDAAWRRLIVY